VGLVARVIEAAGVSTAVHSTIPELTVSVGAPRVVGIGYPGSAPLGLPGDADGQRAVLLASLRAAFGVVEPGGRVDLAFEWPQDRPVPRPPRPPPIARAIIRRPWLYWNLLRGEIPRGARIDPDPGKLTHDEGSHARESEESSRGGRGRTTFMEGE
jgi:D-proline reductase (dithiol) PrdB